jgi:hypothetical protein
LYPDYTFDAPSASGGGGAAAQSSSQATASGGAGPTTSSSTSVSSSSSPTTSVTTTSSSSAGGGPPVEDCLNGLDDDGNGLVDCEDPACIADYECVDAIPPGLGDFGYVGLYDGSDAPPPCEGDVPTKVFDGDADLMWSPATCTACGCMSATGQGCDITVDLDPSTAGLQPLQVANTPCATPATALSTLTVPGMWSGVCFQSETLAGGQLCNGLPCNASVTASAATVSGGACAASGGAPMRPTATFATHGRACRATREGRGCPAGQVCLPKPAPPFEPRVCVGAAGDVMCPSPFVTQIQLNQGMTDTRDCTSCSCGPASGGSCSIAIELDADSGCGNKDVTVNTGSCANIVGNPAIVGRTYSMVTPPSGGHCTPTSTSTPTGSVTADNLTTFCCLP